MFIQHNDKIVNTDNVSNISIEENKIIFNMNYSVSLHENLNKMIPDYVYFSFTKFEKTDFEYIENKIRSLGWISSEYGCTKNGNWKPNKRIINPKCLSFIKIDDIKNRIIFNLNASVSFYKSDLEKTSDFVFYDYDDEGEFREDCDNVGNMLNALNNLNKGL